MWSICWQNLAIISIKMEILAVERITFFTLIPFRCVFLSLKLSWAVYAPIWWCSMAMQNYLPLFGLVITSLVSPLIEHSWIWFWVIIYTIIVHQCAKIVFSTRMWLNIGLLWNDGLTRFVRIPNLPLLYTLFVSISVLIRLLNIQSVTVVDWVEYCYLTLEISYKGKITRGWSGLTEMDICNIGVCQLKNLMIRIRLGQLNFII